MNNFLETGRGLWVLLFSLLCCAMLALFLSTNQALAVVDGHEYLFDREVDAIRFKSLSQELRCPTCQNQNIADSNSPIAKSLRDQLFQLIKDGESDQAIRTFMTDRYGDFILYSPPFKPVTYLLWFGPVMILGLMVIIWKKVVYGAAKADAVVESDSENMTETENDDGLQFIQSECSRMNAQKTFSDSRETD